MNRKNGPDFIALGAAVVYTLCFCLLPFYRILVVNLNGWNIMQYINPILCLPLVLGLLMCVSSFVIDERISAGLGTLTFVVTLVLALTGGSILLNGNGLTQMLGSAASQYIGMNVGSMLPISLGVGAVLCLVLSAIFAGAEFYMATKKKTVVEIGQNNSDFHDPFEF